MPRPCTSAFRLRTSLSTIPGAQANTNSPRPIVSLSLESRHVPWAARCGEAQGPEHRLYLAQHPSYQQDGNCAERIGSPGP